MLLTAERARLNLADDEVARLVDACDSRLEVSNGFVWVTVDGDQGDVVLGPGESYVIDTRAPVTVSALRGAAALDVRAHAGTRQCRDAGRLPRGPSRLDRMFAGITLGAATAA
jgi:hypothetical protein